MNKKPKDTLEMQTIDEFVASIEAAAFRIAELATKNSVDAMDIVELAVKRWVKKYSHKPSRDWLFLFYKTLYGSIADFERREIPVPRWFNSRSNEAVSLEVVDVSADKGIRSVEEAEKAGLNSVLITALGHLPLPQQQAFLLTEWLGFSAEQVALMLAEAPLIIKNRCASALLGLRDALMAFNKDDGANLKCLIIRALEESAADISYIQQYQLRHIRIEAVKQKQAKPILKWVIVSGVMSICLFVFWSLQIPHQTDSQVDIYSTERLTSHQPQAWKESAELLEDMDFFAWLSLRDSGAVKEKTTDLSGQVWENLSQAQQQQARQHYYRWVALSPERKATLRSDFALFRHLKPDVQQALRDSEDAYSLLSSAQQQALRLQWQNATEEEKQRVASFMVNARAGIE